MLKPGDKKEESKLNKTNLEDSTVKLKPPASDTASRVQVAPQPDSRRAESANL